MCKLLHIAGLGVGLFPGLHLYLGLASVMVTDHLWGRQIMVSPVLDIGACFVQMRSGQSAPVTETYPSFIHIIL